MHIDERGFAYVRSCRRSYLLSLFSLAEVEIRKHLQNSVANRNSRCYLPLGDNRTNDLLLCNFQLRTQTSIRASDFTHLYLVGENLAIK